MRRLRCQRHDATRIYSICQQAGSSAARAGEDVAGAPAPSARRRRYVIAATLITLLCVGNASFVAAMFYLPYYIMLFCAPEDAACVDTRDNASRRHG